MSRVFIVKATIIGSNPPIYRQIKLSDDLSLQIIHEIMQACFNWGNVHLHYFMNIDGNVIKDEELTLLRDVIMLNQHIVYVYDYGDSWTIKIDLMTEENHSQRVRPICTDGKRQSPPEDCGGMVGYEDALDLLAHHNTNDFRKYPLIVEWYGEDYDPEFFDINLVNSRLSNIVLR